MTRLPNPLPLLLSFIHERFQSWWQARTPPADQIKLTQHNVYILPTGLGFMLGVTLLALLVISINYQLSLGYVLTFLLGGSALVGMQVGHGTLRGLTVSLGTTNPQFVGRPVHLDIRLSNPDKKNRYGLGLSLLQIQPWTDASNKQLVWTDVPAQGSCKLQLTFIAKERGLQPLPALTIETRFPLGSFRVWAHWRPAAQVLIYPRPEANPPALPIGLDSPSNMLAAQAKNNGEFDGIRSYRRGDALKQVIWKKAAKADTQGNGLVVREVQKTQQNELWLELNRTDQPLSEAAVSRLCAWVLAAHALELEYGIRLPGQEIKPAFGIAHQRRCLEALALC